MTTKFKYKFARRNKHWHIKIFIKKKYHEKVILNFTFHLALKTIASKQKKTYICQFGIKDKMNIQ